LLINFALPQQLQRTNLSTPESDHFEITQASEKSKSGPEFETVLIYEEYRRYALIDRLQKSGVFL